MSPERQDYYSILGSPRNASQEDIKRAYFVAAQKLHPDKNTAAGETELFLGVQQAYETLSNPKRREQYDATLPPEQKIVLPYSHQIYFSRPNLVNLDEPQMLYTILELDSPIEARQAPAPPMNVCLVLDRSTSMRGEKMDLLKSAAAQVLRNLRPQDVLSVVVFSDRAEVIIPASFVQDRIRLEAKVQMIQPGGATEIYQGLEAGAKEVMRSVDSRRINHIVLLTDGHTYGDEQQCLALASKLAEHGVGVSGRLLLEKFNALAQTYAEDAALTLVETDGVALSYAFRLQPDPAPVLPQDNTLHMGPILQDTSTRIIFEYIIQPKAVKSDVLTVMDGTLNVSIASLPMPVPPLHLRLQRPVSDSPEADPPPPQIVQALSRLMLYRMQERARKELEDGNVEKATTQLRALASNLLTQGERSLAQTVLLEADHLQEKQVLSAEGSKKMNYGTRALFTTSPKKEQVS
jgi:Ca-activated chloride channel family protein